ncbi:hypothetical protein ACMD2_19902 [Ananas comosus]|uniref:Uncharacterized protein n=1 Tax=Ananas comosus TaxID=4615 RepID=A0A199VY09_ANACO|nr:hypothetical protein ACMD2_19902 [Ananas comosus]
MQSASTSLLSAPFPATLPNAPKIPATAAAALPPSPPCPSALPRRLFFPSASAIWDALTGGGGRGGGGSARSAAAAALAVRRGMQLFRQFSFLSNVKLIFEEGAEQFRLDVAANPNDTEESIWCFLCEAQLYGVDEARKRFLEAKIWQKRHIKIIEEALLKVGRDPRPIMRDTYLMFRDAGDPEKLVSTFSRGRENEYFYSSLYAGLFYESQNDMDSSKHHILAACKSPYGLRLVGLVFFPGMICTLLAYRSSEGINTFFSIGGTLGRYRNSSEIAVWVFANPEFYYE